VSLADFNPRQRRIIVLLIGLVVLVFAALAGFVITSYQGLRRPVPSPPPTVDDSPLPTPVPVATPAAASVSVEGLWSQVQAARLFDQVARQVDTLRALPPRAEVPLSFLDEQGLTILFRRLYQERGVEAQLAPYQRLGLLPEAELVVEDYEAAGVYVPEHAQLYIAEGETESSADDQALLAHAYVHALQDQHFDLEALDERATTTDAQLAVDALVEGDAALLTARYRYDDVVGADWDALVALILEAERPARSEALAEVEAWTRLRRFPYDEGRQFAWTLFQAGGWPALDAAYVAPPLSTEQVLHPERYGDASEVPAAVVVPDLSATLGEGWSALPADTMGEFVMGLYLSAHLPSATAWEAADGWAGDTLATWRHGDGRWVLVWRSLWDDSAQAGAFERALASSIPPRYLPARPVDPPAGVGGRCWATEEGGLCVYRVARYVTLVRAPDVNALTNVVEVLP
jgi:hypothetical protein